MNQKSIQEELLAALLNVNADPKNSQLVAEKAVVRAQRYGWIKPLATGYLVLGWSNAQMDFPDQSLEYFQRACTLFKDVRENEKIADCYYGLGHVYASIGQYSLAIEQYRKSLTWAVRNQESRKLISTLRIALSRALMNMGYWSDAEQELLSVSEDSEMDDLQLTECQLCILRLAFYRGDQRSVKEQVSLCQDMVLNKTTDSLSLQLEFFSARYELKYGRFKAGIKLLKQLWERANHENVNTYFFAYEASLDLMESDYPEKGVDWLSKILEKNKAPTTLKLQIHLSLAHFFNTHVSYELSTKHFIFAEELSEKIRHSEVNQQWAKYRAEEMHQSLQNQLDQHKKSNQILAESNALLQAVNRIALVVNSALELESLLRRLRDELIGWIDADFIAIAEVKDQELHFNCNLEDDVRTPSEVISMDEERAWSVQAVKSGRIMYENNFSVTNELKLTDSANLVRSISFTPLKCDNRVIGLLSLQSRTENAFDTRAISLLEYISPVIGIAFANLVNLERTRELSGALSKQQQELDDVRKLMAHISDHDELTGLPNRHSLVDHFNRWKLNSPFYCILLGISNLKELSADVEFGMDEEIVKVIGQRLRNRVRPDDLLIRLNSNQFALFVEDMKSKSNLIEFTNQILMLSGQPLRAKDKMVRAEMALGVVQYPEHGETIDELMSMAGVALNHAEEQEDSTFIVE